MKRTLLTILSMTVASQMAASVSYARDNDCRSFGKKVVGGAIIGGVIGAILGNNTGDNDVEGREVAAGAAVGGLAGAISTDATCRDDDGRIIVYRDYPRGPYYRPHHGGYGRPDHRPPSRMDRVIGRREFDREFMDYFSRLRDPWEQSREIRNFADRLDRRGGQIDGRMLYDVLMYVEGPRRGGSGEERLRALSDLRHVVAPLLGRERSDLERLFDPRERAYREARRLLDRM